MTSLLSLSRLRIMQGGGAAYDEEFHLGVNIIRGDNGSGKSTIADFIFFALGGEFDNWKGAATSCDEVQAELLTASGVLSIRRSTASKQEPVFIHFGSLEDAHEAGLDGWERFPLRRSSDSNLSFSQILFRSSGIPEAPSIGGSNVTAHQILRLLYGDQQTPAGRLFRFEQFDTRDIRQAVGDLLIGVNSYQLYESQLRLRQLKNDYADQDRLYNAVLAALPNSDGLANLSSLNSRIEDAKALAEKARMEIENVDELVGADASRDFVTERDRVKKHVQNLSKDAEKAQGRLGSLEYELKELDEFVSYLEDLQTKLAGDAELSHKLGDLEFRYCPACLKPLSPKHHDQCVVCGEPIDVEKQRSRYLEIKIDNDLQVREARQVREAKKAEAESLAKLSRETQRAHREQLQAFFLRFEVSNSPREAFLADRNRTLGIVERELRYLDDLRESLMRLDALSRERARLNDEINTLEASIGRMASASLNRTREAMALVAAFGKSILKNDLRRQEEFEDPKTFSLDFADDTILVDGKMNFAESSNVIAKNSALLALMAAASTDSQFWHPRFILMDNIEDKGMQEARSQNFQQIIVEQSESWKLPHQVIFTTSMMNPALEQPKYTIGEAYTRGNKALKIR